MANIKSKKKRVLTNEKSRQRNIAVRSAVRTARRKVVDAVEANDLAAAKELFIKAESVIAKAGQKGVYKKETVARRVSRLAKYVATADKASAAAK